MTSPGNGFARGLVGESAEMVEVRRLIRKAAATRFPVLLLGESGTGKEVVARAIHDADPPEGRFVPIDCGGLAPTLTESELFGHVRGSFSGAVETKKGLVEMAEGGTAFLDEIGELPIELQVKLLRFLQEQEVRAVGATSWRKVDLRVIAATNVDLKTAIRDRRFRQDLYYRLKVITIRLPPLRERKGDIPLLIDHFLREHGDPETVSLPAEVLDLLMAYDWPGNVRELQHCIKCLVALRSESVLRLADMPSELQNFQAAAELDRLSQAVKETDDAELPFVSVAPKSPVISIAECEQQAIASALASTGRDRGKAAVLLGISRSTLYRRMKQYRMD